MGLSIQLPEHNPLKKRRLASRLPRKFLNAVILAVVLLLWFLRGVPWISSEDEDSRVEVQAVFEGDLGGVIVGVNNLVIVTCHAIWLGGSTAGDNEAEWWVTPFPLLKTPAKTSIAGQLNLSRRARQRRLSSTSKEELRLHRAIHRAC